MPAIWVRTPEKNEKTQERLYAEREAEERSAEAAESLGSILGGITIGTENIRISLQPVNRTTGSSRPFVFAPPVGPSANAGAVSLIEDAILLPGNLLLRSGSYLRWLYEAQHLSAREIARRLRVSHSTVLAALASVGEV